MSLQVIALSTVCFRLDDNVSRTGNLFKDEADRNALIDNLLNGWDVGLGVLGATPIEDAEAKKLAEYRSGVWDQLKADLTPMTIKVTHDGKLREVTVPASIILQEWERLNVKNGKIITPKYAGVYSFRRNAVMHRVNAVRAMLDLPPILEAPASIEEMTPAERAEACVRENLKKTAGSRSLGDADMARAAREMFQLGVNEAGFVRSGFKRGMAQKLHRLMKLDAEYPKVGIVDSIISGDQKLAPFGKEDIKKLLDGTPTEAEVKAFAKNPKGDAKTTTTRMTKSGVEGLRDQSPLMIVRLLAKIDLGEEDVSALKPHLALAEEYNAVFAKAK